MSNDESGRPNVETPKTLGEVLRASLKEVTDPFVHLVRAPRALWGINVSYVLEGLVYFGILTILGKYLSENAGLRDLHAGWVYSALTGGITLSMLFLGGVADRIGVRKAMLAALGAMFFGRLFLAGSGTFFAQGGGVFSPMFLVIAFGLLMVVVGYGMYQPAAYAAVKQFTDEKTAAMGYAMIYGLMNLGAFFSGMISAPVRRNFGIVSVFWVYVGMTALAFLAVLFILTRAVEKRDTLTDIGGGGKQKPKKEAVEGEVTPGEDRPLLDRRFFGTLVPVLLCVAALVFGAVRAPSPPLAHTLNGVRDTWSLASEAATEPGASTALAEMSRQLGSYADEFVGAGGQSATASVDRVALGLIETQVRERALWLGTAAGESRLSARLPGEEAPASRARDVVRAQGIVYMCLAYALVDRVDEGVVLGLQQRMKLSQEERVPLPDGLTERIVSAMEHPLPSRLLWVAGQFSAAADELETLRPEPVVAVSDILRSEGRFLSEASRVVGDTGTPASLLLLKETAVSNSVFLLQDLAPLLASAPTATPIPEGAVVASARAASFVGFVDVQRQAVEKAFVVPLAERLQSWALRYGVAIFGGLVFLGFFVRNLLAKRPTHPFHDGRFVFFIFVLIPVQTLFAHNWLTLPYYINRAFGGSTVGDNFEFFSNINPILIFFLSPMVAALTARRKVYDMMIWGTLVMALPTFLLVLGASPALLLAYILLMSIGEAMWQPRFLQWVAEIAPEGKTGAYMGIAQFPWFLTKVITGLYSGWFLAHYCPMVGPQNTRLLWLIYGIIAMVSPVALWFSRGWMRKGMREKAQA